MQSIRYALASEEVRAIIGTLHDLYCADEKPVAVSG
jgi:hypothetical protein